MTRRVWFFPRLPVGARILEIGSGEGEFAKAAKAHGWIVDTLEPAHGDRTAEQWAAGLDRGWYDAIFMWQVIEHLTDPFAVCRAARLSLKPWGYLVLSTPSTRSLECWLLGRRWDSATRADHRHFFSPTSIRLLLYRANFWPVTVLHQRVVKHVRGPRWLRNVLGVVLAALHLSSRITVVARLNRFETPERALRARENE